MFIPHIFELQVYISALPAERITFYANICIYAYINPSLVCKGHLLGPIGTSGKFPSVFVPTKAPSSRSLLLLLFPILIFSNFSNLRKRRPLQEQIYSKRYRLQRSSSRKLKRGCAHPPTPEVNCRFKGLWRPKKKLPRWILRSASSQLTTDSSNQHATFLTESARRKPFGQHQRKNRVANSHLFAVMYAPRIMCISQETKVFSWFPG